MAETAVEVKNNSQRIIQEQMLRGKIAVLEGRLLEMSDRLKVVEDTLKNIPKRKAQEEKMQ